MLSELPYWFWAGVAAALGLTLGSFLNVVIHRLPRGESVAFPASRCPSCGTPIHAYDNIPVFSWLLLRGKARCCGAKISPRYPLVELIGGLCGLAVLQKVLADTPADAPLWHSLALFWAYLVLGLGLLAAIFIDIEFMLLPDEITLGGAALGLATASLRHVGWTESLVGAAVGFIIVWLPFHLVYQLLRGHPGMGLGDAKLVMLSGAWFGWKGALFALLAGAVQGTVVALAVLAVKGRIEEPPAVKEEREELRRHLETLEGDARKELEEELAKDPLSHEPGEGIAKARVPFGPFLAIATIEYLLFGEALVNAYLWMLWNA
jgi:leader peptidase (prepilin peptidase) / N-methyltransferase